MSASVPDPSTNVVSSLLETTLLALPKSATSTESNLRPTSSLITFPPVRIAMSCNIALRRSPKPGALTPRIFNVPRNLFTTRVAKASPSISSAIITTFLVTFNMFSKAGKISATAETFLSVIRI